MMELTSRSLNVIVLERFYNRNALAVFLRNIERYEYIRKSMVKPYGVPSSSLRA